uniref:Uncharacterized protein n=1 Tax=Saccharolobus solfataricus (strain ATCC 35092 / DSM 1617 / JCM 11322 / P2) TaxID=273057 RepID=A5GXY0_SACS2|nr:hypothetical protein [Saccharolobus solfataricus]ABA64558.1 hypothetical protein [Saccharolobus solfataricus P2]
MTKVICPVCGKLVEIKEVKLDKDKIVKDINEERTPMDYAMRNYEKLNEDEMKRVLKRIAGKNAKFLISNFNELKDLAYELQNKTLNIRFSDGHTYVIHMYYILEVMRYMALAPSIRDFIESKKIPGENDEIKMIIAYFLIALNPIDDKEK